MSKIDIHQNDVVIAIRLITKYEGTGGGMFEAIKEALKIGRCQEFERRNPKPE
jgi:hypothetical protein